MSIRHPALAALGCAALLLAGRSAPAQDCTGGTIVSRLGEAPASLKAFAALQAVEDVQAQLGRFAVERGRHAPVRAYGKRLTSEAQGLRTTLGRVAQEQKLDQAAIARAADVARDGHPPLAQLGRLPPRQIDAGLLATARLEEEKGISALTDVLSRECTRGVRSLLGDGLLTLESELIAVDRLQKKLGKEAPEATSPPASGNVSNTSGEQLRLGTEAH